MGLTLPQRSEPLAAASGADALVAMLGGVPREYASKVSPTKKASNLRRITMSLRDHARARSMDRVKRCGRVRIAPEVGVMRTEHGAFFSGIETCGSVWGCPVCRAKKCAERARQIGAVVRLWHDEHGHGPGRAHLLTFTIRHTRDDDLATLGAGLLECVRKFWGGKQWKAWRDAFGAEYIRGFDITHGRASGWHPHIHALLLTEATLDAAEVARLEAWFHTRWCRIVARTLGEKHVPNVRHGVDLRPCTAGEYVAKLGLEVTSAGTKQARKGDEDRHTPLGLLASHQRATLGDPLGRSDGLALWLEYAAAMKGRRQLTWSRGLRPFRDEAEEQLADEVAEPTPVLALDAAVWDELRDLVVAPLDEDARVAVCTRPWGDFVRVFPLDDGPVREAVQTHAGESARSVLLTLAAVDTVAAAAFVGGAAAGEPWGVVAQNAGLGAQAPPPDGLTLTVDFASMDP